MGALLVVMALALTSCGSNTEKSEGGFSRALTDLPDIEAVRSRIFVTDFASARDIFGIALPDSGASSTEITGYIKALESGAGTGGGSGIPYQSSIDGFGPEAGRIEDWRNSVGFTPVDVDLSIVGGLSPDFYEILHGRIDTSAVDRAVRSDAQWSDRLEEKSLRNQKFYSWEQDGSRTQLMLRNSVRRIGRGHRLLASEDTVFWTLNDPEIHSLIDVSEGQVAALSTREEFVLMARALESEGVYSGLMSDLTPSVEDWHGVDINGFRLTPEDLDERQSEARARALSRFHAHATGVAYKDGQYGAVTVLVFTDEDAAESNIGAARSLIENGVSVSVQRFWSDFFQQPSVRRDGRMLIITAWIVGDTFNWLWPVFGGDPVFYHE